MFAYAKDTHRERDRKRENPQSKDVINCTVDVHRSLSHALSKKRLLPKAESLFLTY